MKYAKRPRPDRGQTCHAARYEQGGSLDELLEVARKADSSAQVAEVPSLGVLVVKYTEVPDDAPSRLDYEVIPDGHYLVYSESFDLLVDYSPESFDREYQPI